MSTNADKDDSQQALLKALGVSSALPPAHPSMSPKPPAKDPTESPSLTEFPAWLTEAVEYLRGVSDYTAWRELVELLVAFEVCLEFPNSRVSS